MPQADQARTTARVRKAAHPTPEALAAFEAAIEDLARGHRLQLELVIEHAIARLGVADGDPDAEPSLGAPERHPNPGRYGATIYGQDVWAQGAADDREEDCEDEGAQCDDEGVCGLHDPDREPDHTDESCHWQDEGDQTVLIPHAVHVWPQTRPSVHQNVGEFIALRGF